MTVEIRVTPWRQIGPTLSYRIWQRRTGHRMDQREEYLHADGRQFFESDWLTAPDHWAKGATVVHTIMSPAMASA